MNRREKLQERYEDALFALLMDDVIEMEGQALLEECERLNADPNAAVPEELDRKCRKLIRDSFRKEKVRAAGRFTVKILKKAAVAAAIAVLLMGIAYAAIPEFRVGVLNLMLKLTETGQSTKMEFGANQNIPDDGLFANVSTYELPKIPNGFQLTQIDESAYSRYYYYKNGDKNLIINIMGASENDVVNVDTENADSVEKVSISGYEGLCIVKNGCVHVAWGDTDHVIFISIYSRGLTKDTVIKLAEEMKYIG